MSATPRDLKRRKTDETDSPSAFTPPSRLKSLKNAPSDGLNYLGHSPNRSSKRIAGKVIANLIDNAKPSSPSYLLIEKDSLIDDNPQMEDFVDSAYHSTSTYGGPEDGGTSGPKKRARDAEETPVFGFVDPLPTSSIRKRRKYKTWSHLPDEQEPGQERSSMAVATPKVASIEGVDCESGSKTRSVTRTDRPGAPAKDIGAEINNITQTDDAASVGQQAVKESPVWACHKKNTRTQTKGQSDQEKTEPTSIAEAASTPTPARKRGRPRKVLQEVKAVENRIDLDLGFKDIPSQRTKSINPPTDDAPLMDTALRYQPYNKCDILVTPRNKRGRLPKANSQKPSGNIDDGSHNAENGITLQILTTELQHALRTCSNEVINNYKAHIMTGLIGKRRLPCIHQEDEYAKVFQLAEQTVIAGEGNSMLVMGARGSGKTNLVENVISELASDHRQDFHIVRLNGFIHTDDKIALREIWRQLGREMDVEDDTKGNYADTLTSLLALLSHPVGDSAEDIDHVAKSVIFILDEFDLFASHPRQTLLYNLFDVAQSRNAPIAVLGLTTKVDVVESLEKRVKSRFSQRYIHVSLPKSFNDFRDICLSALTVEPSDSPITTALNSSESFDTLSSAWKSYITALFAHDPNIISHLHQNYTLTKSIPNFFTSGLLPISMLSPSCIPTGLNFIAHTLAPPDSKLNLLPSLSDLELSLLIAAARLDIILDTDMCNFAMAYDEYQQLASKVKMQSSAAGQSAVGAGAKVWGREVAKGAWERLVDLELVLPVIGAKGAMWRADVVLEEIEGSVEGIPWGMGKWSREI